MHFTTIINNNVLLHKKKLFSLPYIQSNPKSTFQAMNNEASIMDILDCVKQPFFNAINEQDVNIVNSFILTGIDVNASTINRMTALHFASQHNSPNATEILHLLLNAGANANVKAEDGATPLHLAVLTGSNENVELLLDYDADVKCQDNICHFTPLHLAAYAGYHQIIHTLISRGAQVNQTAIDDVTPLHLASIRGCALTVEILVNHGASLRCLTKSGQFTMLHLAVMPDNIIECRDIINGNDNRTQRSFNLEAIEVVNFFWRETLCKGLVANGINVNARDSSGKTALHYAAMNREGKVVERLVVLGANLHLKDDEGYLAFHCALTRGYCKGLWKLIKYGTDVNDVKVIKHLIPQIMAVRLVSQGLIRHLIKMKAANLFISNVYKPFIEVPMYQVLHKDCVKEVRMMKYYGIPGVSQISIYNLLHMMPKCRQAFIKDHKLVDEDLEYEGTMYRSIIKHSFQELCYWKSIVNSAVVAFNEIVDFQLPDLCIINILSFLDSHTLRTIIETRN